MRLTRKNVACLLLYATLMLLLLTNLNQSRHITCDADFGLTINPDDYPGSNDFEKLQNALNSIPPTGANVLIPAKVYEGSRLIVPSKVGLLGANGTVFKLANNATAPFLMIENQSDVTIRNIVLDGNKGNVVEYNTSLIYIGHGCEKISIFNNTFTNFKVKAIGTDYTETIEYTRFITISQNVFHDGEGAAMVLMGFHANATFFMEDITIYGNALYDLTVMGKIGVAFANRPRIQNNVITSCEASRSGNIVIRGCRDVYISKNTVQDSQAVAGIFVEALAVFPNEGTFVIENNKVVREIGDGFSISSSYGVKAAIFLRGNYFNENSGIDIEIPEVEACVYENFIETSMDLSLPSSAVAWGNRLLSGLQGYPFISARAR